MPIDRSLFLLLISQPRTHLAHFISLCLDINHLQPGICSSVSYRSSTLFAQSVTPMLRRQTHLKCEFNHLLSKNRVPCVKGTTSIFNIALSKMGKKWAADEKVITVCIQVRCRMYKHPLIKVIKSELMPISTICKCSFKWS